MAGKLFLIDGMAMIYRSYFAMISNPLINSKGKNTSAVFGFLNSLQRILDDEKPEYIAVCFDTEKPTFRHEEFPEYKAQRMEIPTDMPWQIDAVKDIIRALNIPLIEKDGFEADDIIGTLTKLAQKDKIETYMVTPDKDFMQLVNDKVFLYKPSRNLYGNKVKDVEIYNSEKVREKFGVPPDKVVQVLALMGDTSDNIPGVKGVGEKTAMNLIQNFGSVEDLYNRIEEIKKPKLKENLINDHDNALLAERLVTISTDVPLSVHISDLKRKLPDSEKLLPLLEELEFKSFIKKYSTKSEGEFETPNISIRAERVTGIEVNQPETSKTFKTINDTEHKYFTIKNEDELDRLFGHLSKQDLICFDTETTSTDPMQCELVGCSFAYKEGEAYYIPVSNEKNSSGQNANSLFSLTAENEKFYQSLPIEIVIRKLKPLLENKKIKFVGQNIKYDYIVMKNYGIEIANIYFDSLIGAYILDSDGSHNMDYLSEKYLGYTPISIKELIGSGKNQTTIDKVEVEKVSEYAAEDADITLQLYHRLKYELEKINLYKLCYDIEFPLVKVLGDMEFEGIKVDKNILSIIDKELVKLIIKYENEIYNLAGTKFNINSTKQLSDILFGELSLKPSRKTKTGYSTDSKVLEEIKDQHPIAKAIIDYRMLTKLKSTYIEGLTKAINPKTGRVHTSYNQIIASTGRLSSVNPNLQNVPIRTDAGRSIRKAFVPGNRESLIMSADYSQIELRIMAHFSNDENMISAFKRNHDIHTATSMRIFGVKKSEVTPNMRRKAKEVNFGIIYGIGAFGLANRLEIKNSEAKDIIEKYFREYPKVRDYMERTKEFAHDHGYVETLMGRRRYLPQINNQNASARAEDERAAINMPIQGTAADMIKIAMINIQEAFKKKKYRTKMLLQVHDELIFEVAKVELEEVKDVVTRNMKNALKLNVPIEVEIGVGDSWYDAH